MSPDQKIMVYGAYGHMGKFIVDSLHKRGFALILSGRDMSRLTALGQSYPVHQLVVADMDNRALLEAVMSETAVIVNCAGPFLDTSEFLVELSISCNAHYIDISTEQMAVLNLFDKYAAKAKAAGTVVLPGVAFLGGLADLLSTVAHQQLEDADEIAIWTWLNFWCPTNGTRLTTIRDNYPKLICEQGHLRPFEQIKTPLIWHFPAPIGSRTMLIHPFSEVVSISTHLKVKKIFTYLNTDSFNEIRNTETQTLLTTSTNNESFQKFCMEVVVKKRERFCNILAYGKNLHAFSGDIIAAITERLLSGKNIKQGVCSLGEIFDAQDLLDSIPGLCLSMGYVTKPELNVTNLYE